MPYVLGLDAGGTKTACLVASTEGKVLGRGEAGPANFQSCGKVSARHQMAEAINAAIAEAAIDRSEVVAAYYGVAGADRDADFDTVREILDPINPARAWEIENDSIVGLRAGTPDGVGIGLVAGTGMNAIGKNGRGGRKRVGGLGRFSGDFGAAFDLVEDALFRAMRGHEGRGEPTILYDLFREAFGLEKLEDLIEFYYLDDYRAPDLAAYAPVVFDAASRGDRLAKGVLAKGGRSLASAANAILKALFEPGERVRIVLAGSVLQKGKDPAMIDALVADLHEAYRTEIVKLELEPVLGALFAALDIAHDGVNDDAVSRAKSSYGDLQPKKKATPGDTEK